MQLPDSVRQIRARFVSVFPVPQGMPGEEFEERARQWSVRFAEQVAFELPNQGWGMKRADPNRPISKDTIARLDGGRLYIWDLMSGTGTGSPRIVDVPESEDITGQVFVEVQPTNHLKDLAPPPVQPSSTSSSSSANPAAPADLTPLVEHLAAIRKSLDAILEEQRQMHETLKGLTTRVP
ncbi:MAG: hypothetical protein U0P82_05675 [Vicinamibacterales bacterium]